MATTALLVSTAAVAAAGGVVPFAIAQEEQASLGEEEQEETLADSIVSNVLDDQNVNQANTAEQDDANLGLQDQDATQEGESAQDATNTNVDRDVQVGVQREQQTPPTQSREEPPTTEPPGTPGKPGEPGPTEPPGPPPPPEEPGPTIITITGTNIGEFINIDKEAHDAEICSTSAGVVVTGPGVTPLGQISSCQSNPNIFGWDISPNPDGLDTTYRVQASSIEVREGFRETDNDVYSLDANRFSIFDGPGDDRYDLVGDLVDLGESFSYSDHLGNDRLTFSEEE
jgi:hypothetical protein